MRMKIPSHTHAARAARQVRINTPDNDILGVTLYLTRCGDVCGENQVADVDA